MLRRPKGAPLRIIAEIKFRSPSAGPLSTTLSAGARARVYASCGATMVSVLVDRAHFGGGYHHLAEAHASLSRGDGNNESPFLNRPALLCKGFVIDESQVEAAASSGADAVLLIARILGDGPLRALAHAVSAHAMTPIIEVVDEREVERAIEANAEVIGVNARDLASLRMDSERATRVLAHIPNECVALFLSGLGGAADVEKVARVGRNDHEGEGRIIDGALIGEALMRCESPQPLLQQMVEAAAR
ncbi:MAG: indole-3-glycerol phosphate synthase TrpC [Polyangiales bacterium]